MVTSHDSELGFRKKRFTKEVDGDDDGDEDDGPAKMELRLHSPAGAEPIVYQWPLTSGSGSVSIQPTVHLKLFYLLWEIRNIGAKYVEYCYVIV